MHLRSQTLQASRLSAAAIISGLACLWVIAPSLTTGTLPRDTLEALYWGSPAGWTTPKHPPLAPFAADAVFRASGGAMWSVYGLSQAFMAATFAALAWLGRETLGRKHGLAMALLSAAFAMLLPLTYEFNPNVAMMPFWALTMVAAWRAVRDDRSGDWILLGVCAGLGLLAKYTIAVALLAAAAGALATPSGRKRLARPWGPALAAIIAAAILTPHLLAVAKGDFVTFHVAARDTIWEPERRFSLVTMIELAEFLAIAAASAIPPAVVSWLALRQGGASDRSGAAPEGRRYLIVASATVVGLLVFSGLMGAHMRGAWAMPIGVMIGPLLVALRPRIADGLRADRGAPARAALAIALLLPPAGFMAYFQFAPSLMKRTPLREHVDGPAVARLAEAYWRRFGTGAPPVVLGLAVGALERQAVGSISAFGEGRPPAYQFFWVVRYGDRPDPDLERFILARDWPWIDRDDIARRGGIAVAVGPQPPLWRRLGQCLDHLESQPLPVIRRGYQPQTLWFARIVPGPPDGGPCPPPPPSFRDALGLGEAPRTMQRFDR